MPQTHDTMMTPEVEGLLNRSGSKFRLVTLAAKRARQINAYYGQLGGEGLGAMVPPQVTSVARKPLSIAFEEISAHKIEPAAPEVAPAADEVVEVGEETTPAEPAPSDAG
jgi:DNA-directed RNA polymerase subunit omega